MKILLIATKPKPDNMEFHVIESLNSMGHEVLEFDIRTVFNLNPSVEKYAQYLARTLLREPERIHEKKLLNYAKETSPDLVIVLLGYLISPKTIQLLKKHIAAPIVCWGQDALSNMGRQYVMGSPYDHVFLKDHYMVDLFNNMLSGRYSYLPEACNPNMHYHQTPPTHEASEYECDVTTAATLYYYRQEILRPINALYKLKIWGDLPDWLDYRLGNAHTGKYIIDREKRYAFSTAKIVLNTLHYAEIDGVNCRFFEIPGCGGFQLVSEKAEVSRFFEIGTEVETFRNKDDLIEKIQFYLNEPEKRAAIAKNGLAKAHSQHTYTHRLTELLETVKRL